MRTFVSGLFVLLCILTLAPRAEAQSAHAAPPSAIDEALEQHLDSADADRALVQRVLEQPAVRALAAELGIDVVRAKAAVTTLEGEPLARLAAQAGQVDRALAGGQGGSVTLSYTLIIIGLLVLILLVLIL
jgi:pyruvate/2-oxoglutarate dehydrogenase complex dihydrolipoamide acyltransferase (E2) component